MVLKKYKAAEIQDIQTIGVIMWGLIGDVIIRTPVIKALKEIYPSASITAIVDAIGKGIVENNPYIDDVLISKRKGTSKLDKQFNKIKNILDIRDRKFDLLVNLYNGGSSPLVVMLSAAKYKVGFCNQTSWHKYIYNIENKCASDRLQEKQSLYNYMISIVEPWFEKQHQFDLRPVFTIPEKTIELQKQYLEKHTQNLDKLYILNLGTSDTKKMLESEKMYALVRHVYDKYEYYPAIVCNPGQEYLQNDFVNNFLVPNDLPYLKLEIMDFKEIAATIKLTRFIVTHDTGLMHLAMSEPNNKIFAIFTYTHPLFVDIKHENTVEVYDSFGEDALYQKQNIEIALLCKKADELLSKN